MEQLHAPWRIEYILAAKHPRGETSLFTRIAQSNDDVANYVIDRQQTCFVLLNRYPYNGGHLMLVPYRQVADLGELNENELLELMKTTCRCQKAVRQVMNPDGFNIGLNLGKVAGAGITEHLHLHLVPRWQGDANFMPVIADTSVLPEALEGLAGKLREALKGIPSN